MFSSEIKETVYIAVSLMILALVLGMVVVVIDIRSDFAEIRNDEIATAVEMREYRKYNKYNVEKITGTELIVLIKEFYDTDIEIYIDELKNGSDYYIKYEDFRTGVKELDELDYENLKNIIDENREYKPYFKYDFDDVKNTSDLVLSKGNYSVITGITIVKVK